jgi:glycosyltransferase domain-containing protein
MRKFSGLNNLTLLMPTFNRQRYAKRAIDFWSNTDVNLIVLDGSPNPIESEFTSKLSKQINYIQNQESWIDRIVLGSNLSETTYTMLICDDEFYLPSALKLLIRELNLNKHINTVTGLAVAFYPYANTLFFRRIYREFKNASVQLDDPIKRVVHHMKPYAVTSLYGMNRTQVFRKNIEVAKICSILPDPASFELGFEIANSYQGKTKVIPVISWLRSMENPPIWNTKAIQTHTWWIDRDNDQDLENASSATETALRLRGDYNNELEEQVLYIGLSRYVCNFVQNSKKRKKYSLAGQIKKSVPYRFYFFFIWLLLLVFKNSKSTTWQSKNALLKQLEIEKIGVSIDDLNEIDEFIQIR